MVLHRHIAGGLQRACGTDQREQRIVGGYVSPFLLEVTLHGLPNEHRRRLAPSAGQLREAKSLRSLQIDLQSLHAANVYSW